MFVSGGLQEGRGRCVIDGGCYLRSINPNTEPIGSKAPSLSSEAIAVVRAASNATMALLCQAQAFPVPVFRYFVFFCWVGSVVDAVVLRAGPTFVYSL